MDTLAAVVQYPLACPHCKSYTSSPASQLIKQKKFNCRVCQKVNRLSAQQLDAVKKTLSHMTGCGLRTVKEASDEC